MLKTNNKWRKDSKPYESLECLRDYLRRVKFSVDKNINLDWWQRYKYHKITPCTDYIGDLLAEISILIDSIIETAMGRKKVFYFDGKRFLSESLFYESLIAEHYSKKMDLLRIIDSDIYNELAPCKESLVFIDKVVDILKECKPPTDYFDLPLKFNDREIYKKTLEVFIEKAESIIVVMDDFFNKRDN